MIPIELTISGFLSYRQPVRLDFTAFELACISGANGAGKSSLLDAITWALFGQARKRDDSLINSACDAAQVSLIFQYENNLYRVQRTSPRGKTSQLEFQIYQGDLNFQDISELHIPGAWKTLNERSLRETQERLEKTLRLDYETFVNASFFLQNKADQFTQQRPGDRKRVLSSILGLEIWEQYRQRASELRRGLEAEIQACDGRLAEINAEIAEEPQRVARLKQLESELELLAQQRRNSEAELEAARKMAAVLAEQGRLVETLRRQLDTLRVQRDELAARLQKRQREQSEYASLLEEASQIQQAYKEWQQAIADLEYWEEIASRFREQEARRQEPLRQLQAEETRLKHELEALQAQQVNAQSQKAALQELQERLKTAQALLKAAETKLQEKAGLEAQQQEARQRQAEARAENPRLKEAMEALRERITRLQQTAEATCPLCGQPLSADERAALIQSLQQQGTEMGDRYRANSTALTQADGLVAELESRIRSLSRYEQDRLRASSDISRLEAQIEQAEQALARWQTDTALRLEEVQRLLEEDCFAPQLRQALAEIDAELKMIGYDAQAHQAARQKEQQGRASEARLRKLESAQAALAPLEREIQEIQAQIARLEEQVQRQQEEHDQSAAALAAAQAQAPDLHATERALLEIQQRENQQRMAVGAARQQVAVLDDLKARRKALQAERELHARQVGYHRQLEMAFGKDGVPALLIEQALPQIEIRANDILDRLSSGSMSVRFETQAPYKDRRREELRETLEIKISDSAGTRDYEMFSGGEAFRVNFAVRLALAEVLAQRAGARLQTLVIDEGFGSQDTQGRQRLIEAINLVRQDFSKILVITHIDELKDAFPNRIEVEKTEQGSILRVI